MPVASHLGVRSRTWAYPATVMWARASLWGIGLQTSARTKNREYFQGLNDPRPDVAHFLVPPPRANLLQVPSWNRTPVTACGSQKRVGT